MNSEKKYQLRNAAIDMTEGAPLNLIVRFAFPLVLGNLIQQIYSLSDAYIVSHFIGSDALGSVGVSSSIQFLVLGFCIGFCGGLSVPVAQSAGAKDRKGISVYIINGVVTAVMASVVLTAVFSLLTGKILDLLNTDVFLYESAFNYLLVTFLGIPCTMAYNLGAGILRAAGNSRAPFIYLLISSVFNIILDIILVAFLDTGTSGAAAATVISQAVSGILCFFEIRKMKLIEKERSGLISQLDVYACRRLLASGIPMGLQYSVTAIGTVFVQRGNNQLGQIYTTGFSAGTKIRQFAMCPFDAVASGAAVFAAQNLGAKKYDRIKKGVGSGILIGVLYGVLSGIIMLSCSRILPLMFVKKYETEILSSASDYLSSISMFLWLLGILNVCRMSIQNLGYAKTAVLSGIAELAARIVLCVFLVPVFGYKAICMNEPAAWICASVYVSAAYLLIIKSLKKNIN